MRYNATVHITEGAIFLEVEADSEEEAKIKALKEVEDLVEGGENDPVTVELIED